MSEEKKDNAIKKYDIDGKAEQTHVYLIVDTTGSMGSYITSLNKVLDQILTMINILFAGKTAIHCIQYKDYGDIPIVSECHDSLKMKQWISDNLTASGGDDCPEAAKTALNVMYEYMVKQNGGDQVMNDAICLVYTDAPPHHPKAGSNNNLNLETAALKNRKPGFDWLDICAAFKKMELPIYTFLAADVSKEIKSYWNLLGWVIEMPNVETDTINRATIGVFNQIIGANQGTRFRYADNFKLLQYSDNALKDLAGDYQKLQALNEMTSQGLIPGNQSLGAVSQIDFGDLPTLVFLADNLDTLPRKLLFDQDFLSMVFKEFDSIMTIENVDAFSYNSVFSYMWRYLCRFGNDERQKKLQAKLLVLIDRLSGTNQSIMNDWVKESERQLQLEIEKTEKEIAKAKNIGEEINMLKQMIKDILMQLKSDKNIIVNDVKIVAEIDDMEKEQINAKVELENMKTMTYSQESEPQTAVVEPERKQEIVESVTQEQTIAKTEEWKTKPLKKWSNEDVLEWIDFIGIPPKWRKIILEEAKTNAMTGRDIRTLENSADVAGAFGISDAPKLCDAMAILVKKLQQKNKNTDTFESNETTFKISVWSQGEIFRLKQAVTKTKKVAYVKGLYKRQTSVVANMSDIHFYSRSVLLKGNQTLEQVNITDEMHLITVKFGADGGGEKREPPRCICSQLLTKTKVESCNKHGSICCDHCFDTFSQKNGTEYVYHCNNESSIHKRGYDVCVSCIEHSHNGNGHKKETKKTDKVRELTKMISKAEKRILRLNELDVIIESNLENDIKPKTVDFKANVAEKIQRLDAIIDEGAYGEVQNAKDRFQKEGLDIVEECAVKTQELGTKVKKCQSETTQSLEEMKNAKTYMQAKQAVFKALDDIKYLSNAMKTDKSIVLNDEKVVQEINEIAKEQPMIVNEIKEIDDIKFDKDPKIDSFDEFQAGYEIINAMDSKVDTIANKVDTQINRLQELNQKIEHNLKNEIKTRANQITAAINDKMQDLDTITDDEVPSEEVNEWRKEFEKQSDDVREYIAKNEDYNDKVKECHAKFAEPKKKLSFWQKVVKTAKNAYNTVSDTVKTTLEIAKAAEFRENTSNHRGQVLAIAAAPNRYEIATSAKDKTVKIWNIDLLQNQKLIPGFTAKMQGIASALAYNRIGNYLVAGCAYNRDGAGGGSEGSIVVWSANEKNKNNKVKCVFTSTEKLRFSPIHCVAWSEDSKYIFGGDTVGIIWIWDFVKKQKVAQITAHRDVVNGISVFNNALFSCGLDQNICVFNLDKLTEKNKGKLSKKKSKKILNRNKRSKTLHKINRRPKDDSTDDERHARKSSLNSTKRSKTLRATKSASVYKMRMHSTKKLVRSRSNSRSSYKINKRPMDDSSDDEKYDSYENAKKGIFKSKHLFRNDKYAFADVIPTQNGSHIIATSRKLHCWKFSGFNNPRNLNDSVLEKGVRISDSDFEHIQCLVLQNELMCISRKGKNKVKMFSTVTGKLLLQKKFKGPVGELVFLFDNEYCVVCVQKTDGGKGKLTYKRPAMYMWNYNAALKK